MIKTTLFRMILVLLLLEVVNFGDSWMPQAKASQMNAPSCHYLMELASPHSKVPVAQEAPVVDQSKDTALQLVNFVSQNPHVSTTDIGDILDQKLSSSLRAGGKFNFLDSNPTDNSADDEIIGIMNTSTSASKAYRKQRAQPPRNRFLSDLFRSRKRIEKARKDLEVCALHAAVCSARLSNKASAFSKRLDELAQLKTELESDALMLTKIMNEVARHPMKAENFSKIYDSIEGASSDIRIFLDQFDYEISLIREHLAVLPSSVELAQTIGLMNGDATRSKLGHSDLVLTKEEIEQRASEGPLSLNDLKVIENAKLVQVGYAKKFWPKAVLHDLAKIPHPRSLKEILRFGPWAWLPERLDDFSAALRTQKMSPGLNRTILELIGPKEMWQRIYYDLLSRDLTEESTRLLIELEWQGRSYGVDYRQRAISENLLPLLISMYENPLLYLEQNNDRNDSVSYSNLAIRVQNTAIMLAQQIQSKEAYNFLTRVLSEAHQYRNTPVGNVYWPPGWDGSPLKTLKEYLFKMAPVLGPTAP